jgi:hypothetical protein
MSIGSISAASLSQYVLAAGNSSTTLQETLQSLQSSLASGDLTNAQSAFQTLQNIYQNSATTTGSTLSSNSQFSTDLAALGSALSSGDLSTAQSAFATVLGDLKTSAAPAQTNEATAAAQSLDLVNELLSTVNPSTSTSDISSNADLTTSILQSYYAGKSGLNVLG